MLGHSPLSSTPISSIESGLAVFSQALTANSTVSASISLLKIFARQLSATIASAVSIKRDISKRLISTVASSASSIKSIAKSMQSSITSSAVISTGNLVQLMTATITMSAEVLSLRILTKVLEVPATASAFISRVAAKTLTAIGYSQTQLLRSPQKILSVSINISPLVIRTSTKRLTASATITAILSKLTHGLKDLTASATSQAIIGKLPRKILSAIVSGSASFMRQVYKILTVEITITTSLIYDITRIVRDYLWARTESVTLWARSRSERIIAVSKDASLHARQTTKRLWK
jgi:hypothetical protein